MRWNPVFRREMTVGSRSIRMMAILFVFNSILAAVALFLCLTGLGISIRNQGNTPVGGTAVCFSSFLFAVFGVIYGWASFQEEEKNYILAKIGAPISGLLVIFWIVLILIGLKG